MKLMRNGEYFLSVIIPIYNRQKYIEETVISVVNQPFKNLEILLINDGSTDNSEKICQNLQKEHNNIKYFYKSNSGVSDTRNFGIEKSSGRYIAFLDADDVWNENTLTEAIINCIDVKNPDIVAFGMNYCNDALTEIVTTIIPEKQSEDLRDMTVDGIYVSFCSILYRKEFLMQNKLHFDVKLRYFEDSLFRTKAQYLANSVMIYDDVLLNYRNNPTSVMHTSKQKDFVMDYYKVYKLLYNFFAEQYKLENRKFYVNSNLGQRCISSAYYLCEFTYNYNDWYEKFFKSDIIELFYQELKQNKVSAPEETINLIGQMVKNPKIFYYKNKVKLNLIEVRRFVYRNLVKLQKG